MNDFRLMCELGGAEYLKTSNGIVYFRCRESGATHKLYAFALRSPEDVRLAVKDHLEPIEAFEQPW